MRWALSALCAAVLTTSIGAAAQNGDVRIYGGHSIRDAGISLRPWGSGEVRETEEHIFVGNASLRVVSQGVHQGARLVLSRPVDIRAALADPAAYLQVAFRMDDRAAGGMGGFGGMMMPGSGGPMSGMPTGPGGRTGRMSGPGGPGSPVPGMGAGRFGGAGAEVGIVRPRRMTHLRVVLITTDGRGYEASLPTAHGVRTQGDWSTLAVPVSLMKGLKESSGQVSEVRIFADAPTTFFVGEVRTVRDTTPIRVSPLNPRTVALNDTVTFTGSASGGASPLRYAWTFALRDQAPPATEVPPGDAEGQTVRFTFRRSGEYVVILTVSDIHGRKQPAQARTTVRVTL
ncbi:MAG TPA: PKD domain-containing protein [Chthonomonadales bacterium]|nr:PKD domain-containing protein [Chthonomonadales bacterium]